MVRRLGHCIRLFADSPGRRAIEDDGREGKRPGTAPLLLAFTRERVLARQGRRLRPIDAHDIICKIGECVVAGGVRRTAMISLSDLDDVEMRDAKKGQFL